MREYQHHYFEGCIHRERFDFWSCIFFLSARLAVGWLNSRGSALWDGGSVTCIFHGARILTHPPPKPERCAVLRPRAVTCSRAVVFSLKMNNGRVIGRLTGMDARWLKEQPIWIGAHRRQSKSGESLRGEAAFKRLCARGTPQRKAVAAHWVF